MNTKDKKSTSQLRVCGFFFVQLKIGLEPTTPSLRAILPVGIVAISIKIMGMM